MIDKLGGRKIIFGVLLAIAGILVDSLSAKGLSENLLQLFIFLGVGFFGGNGLEHLSGAFGGGKKVDSSQDLQALYHTVEQANENINAIIQQNQVTHQALNSALKK